MLEPLKTNYHDGITSEEKHVTVNFHDDFLEIVEAQESWKYADILIEESAHSNRKAIISCSQNPDARLYLDGESFKFIKSKIPKLKLFNLRFILWVSVAIASIIALVFFVIPALAPSIAQHIPISWEKRLGNSVARSFTGGEKICANPEGKLALAKILSNISGTNKTYQLNASVIEYDISNAFALPAGQIVIFSKLIDDASSQEEFIAIMAHEAAHIYYRHGTERMLRYMLSALVIDALTGGAGSAAYLAMQYHLLQYGQEQELAADNYALSRLKELNIDATKLADFFARMAEEGEKEKIEEFDWIESYISTHPSDSARIENIKNFSKSNNKQKFVQLLSNSEWVAVKNICNKQQ